MRDDFSFRKILPALVGVLLFQVSSAQTAPDIIFVNGKVLTVDEGFSEVQAVAVSGNKIAAVGSTA